MYIIKPMKFLFDFFPLLGFFITFKVANNPESAIYIATTVLIIASFIQIMAYRLIYKKFENMHLITFIVVLVFGSATLLLHDARFLYWKPTIILWIFSLAALASQYFGEKNLFQRMIQYSDNKIDVPNSVWRQLNITLILFFITIGALNLYVAYNFSQEFWVNFKVFGITILNFLFIGGAVFYLLRHANITKDIPLAESVQNENKHNITLENQ